MNNNFNHIADKYDESFTNSIVGKAQRNMVWLHAIKSLEKFSNPKILELNCGTGEDASWLAQFSDNIIAVDIAEEMITIAKEKNKHDSNINFAVADITHLPAFVQEEKYDFIFSNFGGLNCIEPLELKKIILKLKMMLSPNGIIAAVIMPKYCLWEILCFTLKGRFNDAFRRNTNTFLTVAIASEIIVKTWYHNTSFFKDFTILKTKPIGIFIPPSYLNNFMLKNKRLFKSILWLENKSTNCGFLSNFSDHFYIEISK